MRLRCGHLGGRWACHQVTERQTIARPFRGASSAAARGTWISGFYTNLFLSTVHPYAFFHPATAFAEHRGGTTVATYLRMDGGAILRRSASTCITCRHSTGAYNMALRSDSVTKTTLPSYPRAHDY